MTASVTDILVEAIVGRAAERTAASVVAQLRTMPGFGVPVYATAKNNPLGSKRSFLNAHRRKDFATFLRGREVTARWTDVEAWMISRQRGAVGSVQSLESELAAELDLACAPRHRGAKKRSPQT